jgi:hypothetical protein
MVGAGLRQLKKQWGAARAFLNSENLQPTAAPIQLELPHDQGSMKRMRLIAVLTALSLNLKSCDNRQALREELQAITEQNAELQRLLPTLEQRALALTRSMAGKNAGDLAATKARRDTLQANVDLATRELEHLKEQNRRLSSALLNYRDAYLTPRTK